AKKELVDNFLGALLNLKAEDFKDKLSNHAAGLTRPKRKIDFFDANNALLESYVFGNKVKTDSHYLSLSSLKSIAVVQLKIEELLSLDINVLRKDPPPTNKSSATSKTKSSGGKKVKLEATVSDKSKIEKLAAPIVKAKHK